MTVNKFIRTWSGEIILITEEDQIITEWKQNIDDELLEKEIVDIAIGYHDDDFYKNVIAITVKE